MEKLKGFSIAALSVLILSPDSLLVRIISMDSLPLLFWRGIGLSSILFLYMLIRYGGSAFSMVRNLPSDGIVAAVFFSGSSIFFIVSLNLTHVANTLAIISIGPLIGAVMTYTLLGEAVTRRTWIVSVLAVGCVSLIVSGGIGQMNFLGDFAALANAICLAMAIVYMRRGRSVSMVPAMVVSGLITALIALASSPSLIPEQKDAVWLAILCFGVIPLSFGLIAVAPRFISAPELNAFLLLEMVLGPFFVWLVLKEQPPALTLLGGGLLFALLGAHFLLSLKDDRARLRRERQEIAGLEAAS